MEVVQSFIYGFVQLQYGRDWLRDASQSNLSAWPYAQLNGTPERPWPGAPYRFRRTRYIGVFAVNRVVPPSLPSALGLGVLSGAAPSPNHRAHGILVPSYQVLNSLVLEVLITLSLLSLRARYLGAGESGVLLRLACLIFRGTYV